MSASRGSLNCRRLGRTNLVVSEVSLGTVELGVEYGIGKPQSRPTFGESARILNRALDLGINFIDTARAYGDAEERIGRVLSGRRNEFVLASKVLAYDREGLTGPALNRQVFTSVQASLKALRTETIDVLMIHSASPEVIARGELISILEDLKARGVCRFVGASVYDEEVALKAIESGRYDCLQIAYSILDRRPENATLAAAECKDIGLVARSVLLKGALTYRYTELHDNLRPLREAVRQLLAATGTNASGLPALAYQYVLSQRSIHSALVGASTVEELEAVVNSTLWGAPSFATLKTALDVGDCSAYVDPRQWPES